MHSFSHSIPSLGALFCFQPKTKIMATVSEGEIRELIRIRASADKAFRSSLMDDPKATLEEFLETSLPEGTEIVVVEDSASKTHVVIPKLNDELTDEQLEAVAGGMISMWLKVMPKPVAYKKAAGKLAPPISINASPATGGAGGSGINQSGSSNVSCIGTGGLVNSNMEVSGGADVSG